MDGPIALLEGLSRLFPGVQDTAEFARIGRYYASESMLVWDEERQCYDADATPSYGTDTLEEFSNGWFEMAWPAKTWGMQHCSERVILVVELT